MKLDCWDRFYNGNWKRQSGKREDQGKTVTTVNTILCLRKNVPTLKHYSSKSRNYNFKLYHFKVVAFFSETVCTSRSKSRQYGLGKSTIPGSQQGRLVSVWTNVSLTWDELMSKVRHRLKIYNVLNMSERWEMFLEDSEWQNVVIGRQLTVGPSVKIGLYSCAYDKARYCVYVTCYIAHKVRVCNALYILVLWKQPSIKQTSETVGAKCRITQIIHRSVSSRQLGWQQQMPDAHTSWHCFSATMR